MKSFFNTFLGRETLVIESAYDVETSIQRLQARVGGYLYLLRRGFRATLLGHVGRDVVRLTYSENLMSGPFKPIFRGSIQEQDQVVMLKGHLSFSWLARILLIGCALLFLCFVVIPMGEDFSRGKTHSLQEFIECVFLIIFFMAFLIIMFLGTWLVNGQRSRVGLVNSNKKSPQQDYGVFQ